jgi:predicted dinucleotide-binding enzyme
VVDCVNPLGFDKQGAYALTMPEDSAAQQAAALLPESRVTAAFHHWDAARAYFVIESAEDAARVFQQVMGAPIDPAPVS